MRIEVLLVAINLDWAVLRTPEICDGNADE